MAPRSLVDSGRDADPRHGPRRLLEAPFELFRTYPTGQLVARATADVEPIKIFLTAAISVATQLVGSVVFAIVIMLLIDPELTAIALAPFPFGVLIQLRYSHATRAATKVAEQRRGEVAAQASDNVRSTRLIMSLAREGGQRERFDQAVGRLFESWLRVGRLDAIYGALLALLPYIGLGLVLAFGGRAVLDGRVSLGEFVTFYGFLGMLAAAAAQISYLTYVTASAAASADRIIELLDGPTDDAAGPARMAIRARRGSTCGCATSSSPTPQRRRCAVSASGCTAARPSRSSA